MSAICGNKRTQSDNNPNPKRLKRHHDSSLSAPVDVDRKGPKLEEKVKTHIPHSPPRKESLGGDVSLICPRPRTSPTMISGECKLFQDAASVFPDFSKDNDADFSKANDANISEVNDANIEELQELLDRVMESFKEQLDVNCDRHIRNFFFCAQRVPHSKLEICKNVPSIPIGMPNPPEVWKKFDPYHTHRGLQVAFITIPQDCLEFKFVEQAFKLTCPTHEIIKIEIVRSPVRWEGYLSRRRVFQMRLQDNLNERWLWHGTKRITAEAICTQGYQRQLQSVSMYGQGSYFARDALYSTNCSYAQPDRNGHQTMMLNRVVVGDFVKGKHYMKQPPNKMGQKHVPYESLVDNVHNPSIFVTFTDDQALPEYIITFKYFCFCFCFFWLFVTANRSKFISQDLIYFLFFDAVCLSLSLSRFRFDSGH